MTALERANWPRATIDEVFYILCLSKTDEVIRGVSQKHLDASAYKDPEIVLRLDKHHHAGFVLATKDPDRLNYLLDQYTQRFENDFLATLPPSETLPPSHGT